MTSSAGHRQGGLWPFVAAVVACAVVGFGVATPHIAYVKEIAESDPMEDYEWAVALITIGFSFVAVVVGSLTYALAKRRARTLARLAAGIAWSPVAALGWILLAKAVF